MAANPLLVRSYATNIYLFGSNNFANLNAMGREEYVEPVKKRGAEAYYIDDIDRARDLGFITPQEHADTIALKLPSDPQYRSSGLTASEPEAL